MGILQNTNLASNFSQIANARAQKASDLGYDKIAMIRSNRANKLAALSGDNDLIDYMDEQREGYADSKADNAQDKLSNYRDQFIYYSDPDQMQKWKDSADAISGVDTKYTGPTSTNVMGDVKPGEESVVGKYYSGTENKMTDTANDLMGTDASALGDSINTLTSKLQEGKTGTELAADAQTEAALKGNLTDADSEWYQNQSKVIDQAAQEQLDELDKQICLGGSGAGKANQLKNDVLTKARQEKT